MNREQWLTEGVQELAGRVFAPAGHVVPEVRVSVGWPGGKSVTKVIGQCWATRTASDQVSNVFISPLLADPVKVLATLTHELVHAVDDCESGHRGRFIKIAKGVGLEGKWTATSAGPVLQAALEAISSDLGAYPHAVVTPGIKLAKPQTTRMLKLEAACCGYIVRTTQKWVDEGLPSCPCGTEMELA